MLKPSDIPPNSFSQRDIVQRIEIEQHIDASLKRAVTWPCVVESTRGGWGRDNIEAVLRLYREAGWTVTASFSGLATFNSPDRQ